MGDSRNKPPSQVDSDPALASPPINPIQTGKRDAENVVEAQVLGNKKQKITNGDVEAVEEKNPGKITGESIKVEVLPSINSVATTEYSKKANSSIESWQEDEDHDNSKKVNDQHHHDNSKTVNDQHPETPKKSTEVPPIIKSAITAEDAERASISNESDEDRGDSSDEDHEASKKSLQDVEISDASSLKEMIQTSRSFQATRSNIVLMDNLSISIQEEDVKNFFKNVGEITEVHFSMKEGRFTGQGHVKFTTEEAAEKALKLNNNLLLDNPVRLDLPTERAEQRCTIPQIAGSRTLYIGNLSFLVEEDDVRDFFKDVGEIADIRFAIKDDRFLGYGYIEFTTDEAAQEALKLNKKVILDRRVKLDLARQRGGFTPGNRNSDRGIEKSIQREDQAQGKTKTVYVRGFDTRDGFDNIRSALEKHFGECGEISRLSIPKDYDSGAPRGVAFIDFVDSNGFNQALGLHGSEIEGCRLIVEAAKKQRGEGGPGGWVRENGLGRESGTGSSWRGSGSGRETGSGSSWHRESGSRSSWHSESCSGRESGSSSSWHRESGSRSSWHSKSCSGSDWGGRSGYGCGGGRASGYGYGGGWRSRSGYGNSSEFSNNRRVGGESGGGITRGGWSGYSGGGGGGGYSGSSISRGGWSGYSGDGYSSSPRVGRFSGGYGGRGGGPNNRP